MLRGLTWRGQEIKTHSRETERGATEGGGLRTGRWPASRSERKRSLRNQGRCPDQRRGVLGPQEKQGDLRSPGEQRSGHAATAAWRGSPPRGPGPGARPHSPTRYGLAWHGSLVDGSPRMPVSRFSPVRVIWGSQDARQKDTVKAFYCFLSTKFLGWTLENYSIEVVREARESQ